jgi:3-hydroxymyristoyl/3-hydroxydecanoyl-(acyl carrier protein) dehydratase
VAGPPTDHTIDVTVPAADPTAVDGWLSLPALVGQGLTEIARESAHLRARGSGRWSLASATLHTAGPLPRVGDTLRLQAVTSPRPDGASTVDLRLSISTGEGAVLTLTDGRLGWLADDGTAPARAAGGVARPAVGPPVAAAGWTEDAFKFPARTTRVTLDAADLARLAHGDLAAVFGPAYEQRGANPSVRLRAGGDLEAVRELAVRGGAPGRGLVRAAVRAPSREPGLADVDDGAVRALGAAWDALTVFALGAGLHLVLGQAHVDVALADERFAVPAGFGQVTIETHAPLAAPVDLTLVVSDIDLVPRPWVRADVELSGPDGPVASIRGLALAVRERPGAPVGPARGGVPAAFLGRYGALGEPALIGELQMFHASRGDLTLALGPDFPSAINHKATRLPGGGLRLMDRVMWIDGRRGDLDGGATMATEYDSPADSWYYTDNVSPTMPNIVYMETSLQSALMLGYYLGATLADQSDDYVLRNLDGTATLLREVDTTGRTIQQTTTLLSTTVMQGTILQNFRYELRLLPATGSAAPGPLADADAEPFYVGQSLFGFFTATTLANQTGLDQGEYVATWLERTGAAGGRVIDVAARRAAGAPLCADRALALLDTVTVIPDGGDFGQGYLHAVRPISSDDWFFDRHFWLDPVMPGSLGVEAVIQAIQEWMVDEGLTDELVDPVFIVPADAPLTWRYRGQILADDREMTLEVHVRDVRRGDGCVRVVADASIWKPGMRIYGLTGIAAEARSQGASPW